LLSLPLHLDYVRPEHLHGDMRISLGHGDVLMPQKALHLPDVRALRDHLRGGAVPQQVRVNPLLYADALGHVLKGLPDRSERLAGLEIGEDEAGPGLSRSLNSRQSRRFGSNVSKCKQSDKK